MPSKNKPIRTFLHYSDPRARDQLTVFGKKRDGLHYNYDDRLCQWDGKKWAQGMQLAAKELGIESSSERTARYFEIALNHFHDTDTVDLQHIILGCNVSNGYPYLVFGYTYQESED